ncbi:hypothetical protein SAMN04489723_107164 [Algoriphagus aquimarinus]|uniref:Uncharacterized protein n=1 Tax=Algoriphagus aquimarinus TaxID=237018 RepID=A0A1I1A8A7_9BACT|nr:hypothetical protein SAMN04489723_107164 [Algoriphagus aquimarinus]
MDMQVTESKENYKVTVSEEFSFLFFLNFHLYNLLQKKRNIVFT